MRLGSDSLDPISICGMAGFLSRLVRAVCQNVSSTTSRCMIHEATFGLAVTVFILDFVDAGSTASAWYPLYFLPLSLCFHVTNKMRPFPFAAIATMLLAVVPLLQSASSLHPANWENRAITALGLWIGAAIEGIFARRNKDIMNREVGLTTIFETEPECVKLLDRSGILITMNPAGLKMIEAASLDEVQGQCVYPLIAEEHRSSFQSLNERVFQGESGILQFQLIGLKGSKRWMETHASPIRSDSGNVVAQISVTRDITEMKRLAAMQSSETEILRLIASGVPLAHTLENLARSISEQSPGASILICLHDEEAGKLRSIASAGLPHEYVARVATLPIGPSVGSCGTCAHRKRAVFCEDIATDPLWSEYRKDALHFGIRSAWTVPILDQGVRLLGTLGMFHPTPGLPRPEHFQLVDIASNLAVIAITRARDEKSVRESEQRYREIFLNAPDAVFVLGMEGEEQGLILAANPAADRMHAAIPGSLVGRRISELDSPESARQVPARMRQLAAEQIAFFEVDHRRDDGIIFPVAVAATQIFYKGKACILAFDRDISRQRKADADLRRSQEHLETLIRTIEGIVWECDAATFQFTFVSKPAEKILGYPLSEWTEDPNFWEKHVHPDDLAQASSYSKHCSREMRDHVFEYRMRAADGRDVWIKDVATVVVREGKPWLLRGIMLDVTSRKLAEATLQENTERLRLAVQASNIGFWDWDIVRERIHFSAELKHQMGFGEHDFPDNLEQWESRIHPEDLERVRESIRRAHLEPNFDFTVEFRFLHKDGSWRWIDSRGEVLRDQTGKAVRMLGCHVDITLQKRAEADRELLLSHLLNAEDEERRRIARELHDTTAQQLAVVQLNLARLKSSRNSPAQGGDALLAETCALVEKSLLEVRDFTHLLHPPLLDEFGLAGALKELVAGISRWGKLSLNLELTGPIERLPREVELALFRVAQESLTNIQRHSGSPHALIRLDADEQEIRLEIQDSGRGMNTVTSLHGTGMGIRGMRERLRFLGGTLEIESDTQGTTVLAVVPIKHGTGNTLAEYAFSLAES